MASTEYFLGRRSAFLYAVEDVAYGTLNDAVTYAWPGYICLAGICSEMD